MLATDAHGGFGGIAQYNQDVLEAMSGSDLIERVVVIPRLTETIDFDVPPGVYYDLAGRSGRIGFSLLALKHAVTGGPFDLIYCAHINLLPLAAAVGRIARAPVLLAIYGIDAWQCPGSLVARLTRKVPSMVISISAHTRQRFRQWAPIPEEQVALAPNAIRPERYGLGRKRADLMARYGIQGKQVILTLGRMAPEERYKGFDEIIESMPALARERPDLVYLAAGDGLDRRRLEAKARTLGVADRVVFTGRIPEEEKPDHYRLADAYVMPSTGEGFGFVIIEALACGLPVVASREDGTREAVRNGELGLLVDPRSPADLEQAILAALDQPKQIPPGLSYFSFPRFSERLEHALTCAVAAPRRSAS